MITKDALAAYGADVEGGLERCMGMEDFYLQLVGTMLDDENFSRLDAALESGDYAAAFDAAHGLKGALGNLGLTPLFEPVNEITERLRGATGPVDVSDLLPDYRKALDELRQIRG